MKNIENEIIGKSPEFLKVLENTKKIAQSGPLTTLIIGDSGTGKELIARMIHEKSEFAEQPFIDINCGAIPESLLESELFGYDRGAFTGAYKDKMGLFELGNGGTIFLDEIGNTNVSFQVKLLKVVENKTFRRIGGVKELSVSTRIVAATNVDLLHMVRKGKFREDLYYRLNVYQIQIPPLRKRPDDIIVLANHFIERFNKEYNKNIQGLSPSAAEFIRTYPWPGNVRQLKNSIERAVLVESRDWIEVGDLALDLARVSLNTKVDKDTQARETKVSFSKFFIPEGGVSLEEIEKDIILSALQQTGGNLSQTAKLLHISRGKLRYRLDKLKLGTDYLANLRHENPYK